MKLNNRWLLVVLIAFSQLAILLIANSWMFSSFTSATVESLREHQASSPLVTQNLGLLETFRQTGFFATLLVGLIGGSLMVGILTRYRDGVIQTKDMLENVAKVRSEEVLRTRNAVIFGLAKLAESRDTDTGQHLDRIGKYVLLLSKDLNRQLLEVDEEFITNIELASSLHDIGKVGIPDSILLKPGRLTAEEREIMELHTIIGGECLDAIEARLGDNKFMKMARSIAYSHHERWDGTGYPHGLSEDDVPLAARIVAVADVYDALTSKRPYKEPMSHEESRHIILSGSGNQFDPEVVSAFIRNEEAFKEISAKQKFISDAQAISNLQKLATAVEAQHSEC